MRGLLLPSSPFARTCGITPAHAGLTIQLLLFPICTRDHPRACGAYRSFPRCLSRPLGSPPRMRGLLCARCCAVIFMGITPAHAGLTRCLVPSMVPARDHPRACGAYCPVRFPPAAPVGSPPRMRGLRAFTPVSQFPIGITPAHAGLTIQRIQRVRIPRDHSRACGAYRPSASTLRWLLGSPPRMRGLPNLTNLSGCLIGITPAHAGLTVSCQLISISTRDHPRACGAYSRQLSLRRPQVGSPPRMRGLLL